MKFLNWALLGNTWSWFHALAGGVMWLIGTKLLRLSAVTTWLSILGIALAWEIGEYLTQDVVTVYGSRERFLYDSAGDVLLALAVATLVWLGRGEEKSY
jgi:hypothetical protein